MVGVTVTFAKRVYGNNKNKEKRYALSLANCTYE